MLKNGLTVEDHAVPKALGTTWSSTFNPFFSYADLPVRGPDAPDAISFLGISMQGDADEWMGQSPANEPKHPLQFTSLVGHLGMQCSLIGNAGQQPGPCGLLSP